MHHDALICTDLCTQGFHIIDNFLPQLAYESLCHHAQSMHHQGLFKGAKIGHQVQKQQNNTIRSDEIYWLDEHSAIPGVQEYLTQTLSLTKLFNRELFLGLAEYETHFAAYPPGAFYKKHTDQFATKKTRKISCVYYLNQHWHEDFGGELLLYDEDQSLLQRVQPIGNRFICFNSTLMHEVLRTEKARYSITGWMKTAP